MPRIHLTVRKLESLKGTPTGQIDYWDDSLPCFGIRVAPSGRKSWVAFYRYNRRIRRLTLGTYPAVGLADARKLAKDALSRVAKGYDPAADKIAAREAETFSQLTAEYLQRHAKPRKKSWKADEYLINKELLPKWRNCKVGDIASRDVRALIERIGDRGAKIQANRVLALARKIFNFAIEREWTTKNPCRQVQRPGVERQRDRVLTPDELKRVWNALETEGQIFQAFFKIRLLTAQRGGEVLHMRWSDVDVEGGWWTIPAKFAKNGLAHRVPLNQAAREVLESYKRWLDARLEQINEGRRKKNNPKLLKPSVWVFPSRTSDKGDKPLEYAQRATARIRKVSKVEFVPHDLRRTAASMMTGNGTPRLHVQRILNHAEREVTAVYDRHSYDPEKRLALESWGRHVRGIVEGRETTDNVVPIAAGQRQ